MFTIEMAVDGTLTFAAAPTDMQMEQLYMIQKQNGLTTLDFEDFRIETTKEAARKVFRQWGGKDTTMDEVEKRIEAMVTSSVKGTFSKIPEGVFVIQANEMKEGLALSTKRYTETCATAWVSGRHAWISPISVSTRAARTTSSSRI